MNSKLFVLFSALLVLTSSASASAVTLQATTPKISVTPASLNLGNVKLGGTSGKPITVKNTGTANLLITAVTITGSNDSEFNQTGDCATIHAGGLCAINVTFNPTLVPYGKKAATMTIASNDPRKPGVIVKLSGNTPPPKVSILPTSVNFKAVQAGGISSPAKVKVKNMGTSDLMIGDIGLTGLNASEFDETDDCTTILTGGFCTVTVTFVPTSAGTKSAALSIASNDPKKPTGSVKLSGKATSPPPGTSIWDSTTWDGGTWAE
jgi:hypothetical protein